MSPQTDDEATSSAPAGTSIDNQQNEADAVDEALSSASQDKPIEQPQIAESLSAVKTSTSSLCSEPSIDQQRSSGSSDGVENQLQKRITELEDELRYFKLKKDPKREVIEHTLLQVELTQLREKNLKLCTNLQVVREKYQALESEHHKCWEQMKEAIEKAVGNLSAGLDLSKGASTSRGLKTEGVMSGAALFPQNWVFDPKVEKASGVPSGLQAGNFGFNARPQARVLQNNGPKVPKPPLFDFSSSPFASNPLTATGSSPFATNPLTATGSSPFASSPLTATESSSSASKPYSAAGSSPFASNPFAATGTTPGPFSSLRAKKPTPSKPASVLDDFFLQSEKGGANKEWFPDPAKSGGSAAVDVTPASGGSKKDYGVEADAEGERGEST